MDELAVIKSVLISHDAYNVVTALRGPDMEAYEARQMKRLTTCVLRSFVLEEDYALGYVTSIDEAESLLYSMSEESLKLTQQTALSNHFRHFMQHFCYGVTAIHHMLRNSGKNEQANNLARYFILLVEKLQLSEYWPIDGTLVQLKYALKYAKD
jgi:hypothetical protein